MKKTDIGDKPINSKDFKRWLKLSYKTKKNGCVYYEYEADLLTEDEMYLQWRLIQNTSGQNYKK